MASSQTPYWRLLSVLFSAVPLSPSLALTLVDAARGLRRDGQGSREIAGDVVSGRVTDLRKDALLGTIAGPLFEARVDTAQGSGLVRFLLTREGLEEDAPAPRKPQYMN